MAERVSNSTRQHQRGWRAAAGRAVSRRRQTPGGIPAAHLNARLRVPVLTSPPSRRLAGPARDPLSFPGAAGGVADAASGGRGVEEG